MYDSLSTERLSVIYQQLVVGRNALVAIILGCSNVPINADKALVEIAAVIKSVADEYYKRENDKAISEFSS